MARKLKEDYEAEFLIEGMQPSWLSEEQINFIYQPLIHVSLGLILGMIFSVTSYSTFFGHFGILSPIIGLLGGLSIGLISRFKESIETVETLKWSWKNFFHNLKNGLRNGISFGIKIPRQSMPRRVYSWNIWEEFYHFFCQLAWAIWLFICLLLGLIFGIINGVFQGLTGGLTGGSDIENKILPNQGIWKSIDNFANVFMIWTVGSGLFFALVSSLLLSLLSSQGTNFSVFTDILFFGSVGMFIGVFLGIFTGLERGGKACIQHCILRFIIYLDGDIPWNLACFLDYCTDRLLLQRVGGRYRFIHRLLQEYFAAMPLENK